MRRLAKIDSKPGGTQALLNLPLQCQFDRMVVKAGPGEHALCLCAIKGKDGEQDVFGFNGGRG